jgi:hypothetical protein
MRLIAVLDTSPVHMEALNRNCPSLLYCGCINHLQCIVVPHLAILHIPNQEPIPGFCRRCNTYRIWITELAHVVYGDVPTGRSFVESEAA